MAGPTFLKQLLSNAGAAVLRLRSNSALNTILWMTGIFSIPCLVLTCFTSGLLQAALLVYSVIPVVLFAVAYFHFMRVSPEKLHSEEYLIQRQALDLIEHKGQTIPIRATSIEVIAKPSAFLEDLPAE
jgi:hypothetical protein